MYRQKRVVRTVGLILLLGMMITPYASEHDANRSVPSDPQVSVENREAFDEWLESVTQKDEFYWAYSDDPYSDYVRSLKCIFELKTFYEVINMPKTYGTLELICLMGSGE